MVKRPTALSQEHDLSQFDCGSQSMSDWLKKHALQSDQSGHTKTMVIADDERVIGYYSFAVVSVEHAESTPTRVRKGLARYAIPVFLITRLAVDINFQGRHFGKRLLRHALKRAAILAVHYVPIRAVVVDAVDDAAKSFYGKFDFEPWPVDSFRLWLLMKDLIQTCRSVE